MSDLGPVLSAHEGRFAAGGYLWPVGAVLLVAGPLLFLRGLAAGAPVTLEGLGTAALAMSLGALLLLYAFVLRAQRIVAHQQGFVWTRFLRAPLVVRWDEIRDMRVRTTYGGRGTYHLKGQEIELELDLKGRRTISISNDLDRIEDLRAHVISLRQAQATPAPSPWG